MTTRSFFPRRAVSVCGALMACAIVPLAAHAQQTTAPETTTPPSRFTMRRTTSARQILELLLEQANVPYIIGPEVTGDLSVQFTDLPLATALDRIAQSFSPPLAVSQIKDGTYIIKAGEKGPTRLALSTPPATVSVQQAQPLPATAPPVSVSVVGGDPVAVALELQIINLRVERETGAATQYGPQSFQIKKLDAQIVALEKQLALHKGAKKVSGKTLGTAQVLPQRVK